MAESFLFELAGKVLGQLGSLVVREVSLAWGVESDLEWFTDTLSTIQSVLLDAEEQQQQNTSAHAVGVKHQLKDWLRKLKDVMYDIDDLLDEFHYFCLRKQERSLAEGIGKLTSIRELSITDCGNLKSFLCDTGMQHLPGLQTLYIVNCGKLFSLSKKDLKHLTMLKTLVIGYCETLEFSNDHLCEAIAKDEDGECQRGGGLYSLERLVIGALPKLVVFPQWLLEDAAAAGTLKSIYVLECPNITGVFPESLVENLMSLETLRVKDCPQVMSLPNGMHRLITLRELHINKCPELIRRCQRGIGEDWHKTAHIPNIYLDGEKI